MQAAADSADRHVQGRCDLFVAQSVEFFHHDDDSMIGSELVEGSLHKGLAFESFEMGTWIARLGQVGGIDGLARRIATKQPRGPSSSLAQSQVDHDPVNPGRKRTLAVKAIELPKRLEKSLLKQVQGVLHAAGKTKRRGIEPVLIPLDQHTEGVRPTRATFRDQGKIVG